MLAAATPCPAPLGAAAAARAGRRKPWQLEWSFFCNLKRRATGLRSEKGWVSAGRVVVRIQKVRGQTRRTTSNRSLEAKRTRRMVPARLDVHYAAAGATSLVLSNGIRRSSDWSIDRGWLKRTHRRRLKCEPLL